jgi:alanine racemase
VGGVVGKEGYGEATGKVGFREIESVSQVLEALKPRGVHLHSATGACCVQAPYVEIGRHGLVLFSDFCSNQYWKVDFTVNLCKGCL